MEDKTTLSDKRKELFDIMIKKMPTAGRIYRIIKQQDREFIQKLKEGKTIGLCNEIDNLAGDKLTNHSPQGKNYLRGNGSVRCSPEDTHSPLTNPVPRTKSDAVSRIDGDTHNMCECGHEKIKHDKGKGICAYNIMDKSCSCKKFKPLKKVTNRIQTVTKKGCWKIIGKTKEGFRKFCGVHGLCPACSGDGE